MEHLHLSNRKLENNEFESNCACLHIHFLKYGTERKVSALEINNDPTSN